MSQLLNKVNSDADLMSLSMHGNSEVEGLSTLVPVLAAAAFTANLCAFANNFDFADMFGDLIFATAFGGG